MSELFKSLKEWIEGRSAKESELINQTRLCRLNIAFALKFNRGNPWVLSELLEIETSLIEANDRDDLEAIKQLAERAKRLAEKI